MTVRTITAEIDGKIRKITADIPENATPADIEAAVKQYMLSQNMPDLGKAEGVRGPLTTWERIQAIGKQTLRAAPEMGGMMGGAALGTSVAGIPGGVGGAIIGAITGKETEAGLRNLFPNVMGGEHSYEGLSSPIESLRSGAMAAVAEGGGQIAARTIPRILQRTPPNAETVAAIRSLETHDVPTTAGDWRAGGAAQQFENLLKGTLAGGRTITEKDIITANRLHAWREDFLRKLGPEFDDISLGRAVKKSVAKRHSELLGKEGLFKKLYEKVDELYPAKVDVSKVRSWATMEGSRIERQVQPGTGLPTLAGTKEAPSKYLSLLEDLKHFGQKQVDIPAEAGQPARKGWVDLPITYQDVWNMKQNVDSTIRSMGNEALGTRARSVIQEIRTRLDEAMTASARQVNPKAALSIERINRAYRQAKNLLEKGGISNLRVEGKITDEQVVGRFFRQGSITPARDLYRAIPMEDRPVIKKALQRKTIENIFTGSVVNEPVLGVQGINTGALKAKMRQYDKELKVWLTADQYAGLKEFVDAAFQAGTSGRLVNPASGRQMLMWSQTSAAGSAVKALLTGATGVAVEASSIVGGPYFLAKIMMNKRMSKLIAEGVKLSPTSVAGIKWTPRFMNAARIWVEAGMPDNEEERINRNATIQ